MQRNRRDLLRRKFRLQRISRIFPATVTGAHPNAVSGKMPRYPGPDTARAAGNDGNFSVEHETLH
jgi:hypothetical protein